MRNNRDRYMNVHIFLIRKQNQNDLDNVRPSVCPPARVLSTITQDRIEIIHCKFFLFDRCILRIDTANPIVEWFMMLEQNEYFYVFAISRNHGQIPFVILCFKFMDPKITPKLDWTRSHEDCQSWSWMKVVFDIYSV